MAAESITRDDRLVCAAMVGKSADGSKGAPEPRAYRRIGHKGAGSIVTGNTPESFDAAVELGVDMVELDVLRAKEGRLIVAHDYHDALVRRPMELTEALDVFLEPPLDEVEIDCDLKLPGREAELAGALAGRELLERAMVSSQEIESLLRLRQLEPDLRLGGRWGGGGGRGAGGRRWWGARVAAVLGRGPRVVAGHVRDRGEGQLGVL